MNDKSGLSRRTFLKGTAASAAVVALPSGLLRSRDRRPLESKRYFSTSDDTLTIAFPGVASEYDATLKLLAAFTKNTGITITPVGYNNSGGWVGTFQILSTRIAGGEPLDSAYIATEGMLLFEEQGVLDPLDSFITADQATMNAFYKDVPAHMLANFQTLDDIHGHTYFVPIGYNVMSIWYNRSLFKEFNVPEPAPGWTWDEFASAATKIADAPNRYGFYLTAPVPGPFTDVYPWVLTNGGQILNSTQTKCLAGSPACIEAATFVRGLVKKSITNEPGGAYNQFAELAANRLAMAGGGMWYNASMGIPQAQVNKNFAIVPWPVSTQPGTPVGVGGFPMFKSCKNKAALWEFIKFSFSDEFQRGPVVPFGGDMPIRTSVATDPSFLSQWPQGTEYFTKELAYSTMIVGVPNAGAVESEISNAWESIMAGSVSPAAGMAGMQSQCTTLMAKKVG
jgi:multiple sugar transport system substrate-binding protein